MDDKPATSRVRRTARPYRRFTERRRTAFLDHLAATCDVSAACRAIELGAPAAYRARRNDPAFAEAWRAALLTGYDRLEGMLLRRAGAATANAEAAVDDATLDPEMAIRLLALHQARMKAAAAGTAKPQNRVKRATEAETNAAILKQLAALDRRLKAKPAT